MMLGIENGGSWIDLCGGDFRERLQIHPQIQRISSILLLSIHLKPIVW